MPTVTPVPVINQIDGVAEWFGGLWTNPGDTFPSYLVYLPARETSGRTELPELQFAGCDSMVPTMVFGIEWYSEMLARAGEQSVVTARWMYPTSATGIVDIDVMVGQRGTMTFVFDQVKEIAEMMRDYDLFIAMVQVGTDDFLYANWDTSQFDIIYKQLSMRCGWEKIVV